MSSDPDLVLKLGRDLAGALDQSDVVGRWMSHHLADLITRCEQNPHDEELAAITQDVVLKLWEHKSGASFQSAPFKYLQPVLRTISRLDPNPEPWAFFSPFNGEPPSAQNLTTFPLLQMACDIDQAVGRLIRLSVAVTAQQAISCEEPWVLEGKETARTEQDRAARALEQAIRRIRLQTGPDSSDPPKAELEADDRPPPAIPDGPEDDDKMSRKAATAGEQGKEASETIDSLDPLHLTLLAAIARCQSLIDQLKNLCDGITAPDSQETTHTESVAREQTTESLP